tara:strand:- start:2770 stop:2997 length:228 start_codon:yes stop_codon:yes gene_type:complete
MFAITIPRNIAIIIALIGDLEKPNRFSPIHLDRIVADIATITARPIPIQNNGFFIVTLFTILNSLERLMIWLRIQ